MSWFLKTLHLCCIFSSLFICCREKRQKIEDIKKNIRDAILVSMLFFRVSTARVWNYSSFCFALQTITGAMSTLTPPIPLEHPENQARVDYIQDVASSHDFDYPPVSVKLCKFCGFLSLKWYVCWLFLGILRAHRNPMEGQRCSNMFWKVKRIPAHWLCKVVSNYIKMSKIKA